MRRLLMLRSLMLPMMIGPLVLMVHLRRWALMMQLMRMLAKVLHRALAERTQRAVRLEAVMRRHRGMQATSLEVCFHRQHVFRRRKQLDSFHLKHTHCNDAPHGKKRRQTHEIV